MPGVRQEAHILMTFSFTEHSRIQVGESDLMIENLLGDRCKAHKVPTSKKMQGLACQPVLSKDPMAVCLLH